MSHELPWQFMKECVRRCVSIAGSTGDRQYRRSFLEKRGHSLSWESACFASMRSSVLDPSWLHLMRVRRVWFRPQVKHKVLPQGT